VNILNYKIEKNGDKITKEARKTYRFNLEKKSESNVEWMIKNGYMKKKKIRHGRPGRPT
jgi:hypothetical protein